MSKLHILEMLTNQEFDEAIATREEWDNAAWLEYLDADGGDHYDPTEKVEAWSRYDKHGNYIPRSKRRGK